MFKYLFCFLSLFVSIQVSDAYVNVFSQYIRSWFEISVARRLQLASHQCLLQITCQLVVSQGVQIDGNHWA
jgi:hypothetical protein